MTHTLTWEQSRQRNTDVMQMSRKIAGFLVALAAFMIFEWISLGFNLADGHPTAFYVVHGILIAVNLVLAVVLGVIGLRGLVKRPKRPLV
ncbi:hypothetical protein SAMN05216275_101224 [Streptosporangium canum]|uniref:Uncharacterized protein n=2 Tax=Streptosporangium canum TaxID=324952 RepID=A0A1I3FKU4_9ACTN|nr:hypothetical protein SAMN05216275_101224 [Streptosporangium canum]